MNGLRDELLARARLTPDQHRRGGRRRLLDDLIDLPHLRAAADHLAERAVLAELLAQHLDLAQRVLPLDDLVEQDLEPLRLDRLVQVVVGAFFDRFDRSFDGSLRGQNHDGVIPAIVLECAQQLETPHARHHEVADDDVRAKDGNALKRLFSVARGIGRKAPRTHQLGQTEARAGLVLDDEDAFP